MRRFVGWGLLVLAGCAPPPSLDPLVAPEAIEGDDPVPEPDTVGFLEVPDGFADSDTAWCWVAAEQRQLLLVGLDSHQVHLSSATVRGGDDMTFWDGRLWSSLSGSDHGFVNDGLYSNWVDALGGARGISVWNGALVALRTEGLHVFDSQLALESESGLFLPYVFNDRPQVSRMTVVGSRGYGAWHSTHELEVFDLVTGSVERTVPLEGFEGRVEGLDIVDDRIVLGARDAELRVFDVLGNALEAIPLPARPEAIWCEPRVTDEG